MRIWFVADDSVPCDNEYESEIEHEVWQHSVSHPGVLSSMRFGRTSDRTGHKKVFIVRQMRIAASNAGELWSLRTAAFRIL